HIDSWSTTPPAGNLLVPGAQQFVLSLRIQNGESMNKKRVSVFFVITLSLAIADAGITHYLLRNFGEGQELNPFVTTTNFFSILLSPIPVLLTGGYVWCLLYAERNQERFQDFIDE